MQSSLRTESNVIGSMKGYRQLTSAQLREKLYKTGYKRAKATLKKAQGTTAGQTPATNVATHVAVPGETPGSLNPRDPST